MWGTDLSYFYSSLPAIVQTPCIESSHFPPIFIAFSINILSPMWFEVYIWFFILSHWSLSILTIKPHCYNYRHSIMCFDRKEVCSLHPYSSLSLLLVFFFLFIIIIIFVCLNFACLLSGFFFLTLCLLNIVNLAGF